VAVVTGGAQGIGWPPRALAAAGATVVLWDIDAGACDETVQASLRGGPRARPRWWS
jgi:NAD(P)-dependent dehydrogenase (short-subunit alcohol dehydrogenase family)